jgi:hypothetical protein
MKRRSSTSQASALDLLEEAVHVLRTAPATAWLAYFIGTAPFVLALLFYWSDMSRSAFAENHLVGGAIGITLLFIWMKCWQAVFGTIVRTKISGEAVARWTFGRVARVVARQLVLQPSGLFLLPIALIIAIPFGWLYAFHQNATVLGAREDQGLREFTRHCWREAKYAQMQNHALLSVMFLFGLFALLNIGLGVFLVPVLLKTLLGIDTPFTLSAGAAFNTTFVAVICGVAFLCVDPLMKTAYVLRCFYGESRQSGEDLRVALRRFAVAAIAVVMLLASSLSARAAEPIKPAATKQAINPQELDKSIDDVLRKPEYTWRSPRARVENTEQQEREWKILRRIGKWMRDAFDSIGQFFDKLFGRTRAPRTPGGFSLFTKEGLTYALILLVTLIIGLLLYFVWRIRLKKRQALAEAEAAAPPPDLSDENVTAEQLPEDGWVRLGLEMLEQGDLRLALRAFYLASLAHLAERNLVTLARFKSNRDYERELLRRGHALPEVAQLFSENVSTFDRVWYGLHDVTADLLQQFRVKVERIKSC